MGDFSCAQRVLFLHQILDKDQRPRQPCRFYSPAQARHLPINRFFRRPLSRNTGKDDVIDIRGTRLYLSIVNTAKHNQTWHIQNRNGSHTQIQCDEPEINFYNWIWKNQNLKD